MEAHVELATPSVSRAAHTTEVDGRKLVLWSLTPSQGIGAVPLVIGSGFARRMDHFGPLALYLANAGFSVFRYDSLDHVGLSDGQMESYTLSAGLRSLQTAIAWTCAHRNAPAVGLIATSLTARLAYQILAETPQIAFLVTAVGVVDVRATLQHVFGCDYTAMDTAELPEAVLFERQRIAPRRFYQDYHERCWGSAQQSAAALAPAPQPIVAFVTREDPWVDGARVREVLAHGRGRRRVLELTGSGHDLGRNPAVARTFMKRVTQTVLDLSEHPQLAYREPEFSELAEQALVERRIQRAHARSAETAREQDWRNT